MSRLWLWWTFAVASAFFMLVALAQSVAGLPAWPLAYRVDGPPGFTFSWLALLVIWGFNLWQAIRGIRRAKAVPSHG